MKKQKQNSERLGAAHLSVWLIIAAVVSGLFWAAKSKVAIVSLAMGEVVPVSRVQLVQHLEGGIVATIDVTEGQIVQKNQQLLTLMPTRTMADVNALKKRINALHIDLARLDAELNERQEPDYRSLATAQNETLIAQSGALFKARRQHLQDNKQAQELMVEQRVQEQKEAALRLKTNQKASRHVGEQVSISRRMLANNLSNRMQHLNLVKEADRLKGEIAQGQAALGLRDIGIKTAKNNLALVASKFTQEARREYDRTRRSIDELAEQLNKSQDSLSRTVLRAPLAGIVKAIKVAGAGAVVAPGAVVAEIVPRDRLIIEARLAPSDIGYIHPEQQAKVRLASSDGQRFGALDGTIIHISPDTLVTSEGVPYYQIKIKTSDTAFRKSDQSYQLYPGMQVQCSIISGQRSVLSYLVDPFMQISQTALGER